MTRMAYLGLFGTSLVMAYLFDTLAYLFGAITSFALDQPALEWMPFVSLGIATIFLIGFFLGQRASRMLPLASVGLFVVGALGAIVVAGTLMVL